MGGLVDLVGASAAQLLTGLLLATASATVLLRFRHQSGK